MEIISLQNSLFTISIDLLPHPDTYYNRAACRKKLGDFNGYCIDLFVCSRYGDKEAEKIFWEKCGEFDTTYNNFNDDINSDSSNAVFKEIVQSAKLVDFYHCFQYNFKEELIVHYYISKNDTIYMESNVLTDPEFPGGKTSFEKFLYENTKFSRRLHEEVYFGTMIISFEVYKNGKSGNYEIVHGLSEGQNTTVLDILDRMPTWKPGTIDDSPVNCLVVMPIKFLKDEW